jgi:DHA2 family lincomycin resistance protein-like MFS transporter
MTNTATPETQSTPAVSAEGEALAARNRMALILLLAAVFVVFLNETMMNVALPKIQESLRIDATQGQ